MPMVKVKAINETQDSFFCQNESVNLNLEICRTFAPALYDKSGRSRKLIELVESELFDLHVIEPISISNVQKSL